jgi:hypothetical protein
MLYSFSSTNYVVGIIEPVYDGSQLFPKLARCSWHLRGEGRKGDYSFPQSQYPPIRGLQNDAEGLERTEAFTCPLASRCARCVLLRNGGTVLTTCCRGNKEGLLAILNHGANVNPEISSPWTLMRSGSQVTLALSAQFDWRHLWNSLCGT